MGCVIVKVSDIMTVVWESLNSLWTVSISPSHALALAYFRGSSPCGLTSGIQFLSVFGTLDYTRSFFCEHQITSSIVSMQWSSVFYVVKLSVLV